MRDKWTTFAVLAAFLVLVVNSGSEAVSTTEIDKVREKGVLDSEDLQVIDSFVADAVQGLVKTRDFTSIAKVRAVILARDSSGKESAAAQYAEQFSESAYKYISSGLKQAEQLTPEDCKLKVTVNLLILIDGLEDVRLADLAIGLLNSESMVIRYWAVHSVTNPGIIEQLNSGVAANSKLAQRIVEQLKELVEQSSPEVLALMAEFSAEVDIAQGEELLLQITDMRMRRYADWTVEYELLDGAILKFLGRKLSSAGRSKPAIARRFGQLYSYAIQRYVKGRDILSADQKHQLASVLVETEKSCIGRLVGMSQSVIKKAVERGDYMTLLAEHSRLLGDETRAGQLPLKLNFDYGTNPDGSKRTAPIKLRDPPKAKTSE